MPLLPIKVGYAPKINPLNIKWDELKERAAKASVCVVRFDTPNIFVGEEREKEAMKILKKNCRKSPRSTFTQHNIILDLNRSEEELMAAMNSKTRYNVRLAERKGVVVKEESNEKGIEIFLKLQAETAKRQEFMLHPDKYYRKLWDLLFLKKIAHIMVAYFEEEPLTAWMLFVKDNVLYYPYGASSVEHRDLMASNLMAWEVIKFGKKLGCSSFDMWGSSDPEDTTNSWYGFTKFKLGYGGCPVKYIDSYDLVVDPFKYWVFVWVYKLFWMVNGVKKKLGL
jgi:lipid II:glycine glycyltransferase (peptidoglycan interpeptide bridge formation enzyme)